MARTIVQATAEYHRVFSLPKQRITSEQAEQWAASYTQMLRRKRGKFTLKKEQGASLYVIEQQAKQKRGAVLFLPAGKGKTKIGYLACTLLQPERAIVIAPKSLEGQTLDDYASFYEHWKSPRNPIRFVARQTITSRFHPRLLEDYDPQVVIFDECDEAANFQRSLAARIDRFQESHPDCIFICMTATPVRTSLLGFSHHLVWALKDGAPVPRSRHEQEKWAGVLDEQVRDPMSRPDSGALGHDREAAVRRFGKRLRTTPGVVIFDEDSCDKKLTIELIQASECGKIGQVFDELILRGKAPEGYEATDALSRYRLEASGGCGLYSVYAEPGPPELWRFARRKVARFVRRAIARSRHSGAPLDTTAQVFARYPQHPTVLAWKAVSATYKPKMETKWISTAVLQDCERWLAKQTEESIIWVGSKEFGGRLARRLRIPYFGAGGVGSNGFPLHRQKIIGGNIVCSWYVGQRGLNMQRWHNQLIVLPSPSAKVIEQNLKRTHRMGQTHDVHAAILVTSGVIYDKFKSAVQEAKFGKSLVSLTQAVLRAKIIDRAPKGESYRWAHGDARVKRSDSAALAKKEER